MQTENKKGFQVKDLIVTALLSLCALVIYIICAFLSFSPYTMLVVSPLWSLLAAITYFLVAAKTKKPWALFIFCAVTGIYGFYPPMIICWKNTYVQLYHLYGFSSIQWYIYSLLVFLKSNT